MRVNLRWGHARSWLLVLLPLVLASTLAVLMQYGLLPNLVLGLQVDLGSILMLAGAIASAVALLIVLLRTLAKREVLRAIDAERAIAASSHQRFVRRLDHELKNPLTAMRMGLDNLLGTESEDVKAAALATVNDRATRLSQLTTDLRKLVELESRPLEVTHVDIQELLEQIVAEARQQPEAAHRRFGLSVPVAPWPLPPVSGDEDLLFLAVYNLLDNGLKFTRAGDSIEVRASEEENGVVVEVADTGLGIPDDELPHIFEELYRGREVKGTPGSGLGLALVKAVVERHGGRITVRSRVGRGSVFALWLPAYRDGSPLAV